MTIRRISCLAQLHWRHPNNSNACVTKSHLFHCYIFETRISFMASVCEQAAILSCVFQHCPVVWAGPKYRSRWWHSLAWCSHWSDQFPYHKAPSNVQALQSYFLCRSLLSHLWSPAICKLTLIVILRWQDSLGFTLYILLCLICAKLCYPF